LSSLTHMVKTALLIFSVCHFILYLRLTIWLLLCFLSLFIFFIYCF
jgi:hypothetical protein